MQFIRSLREFEERQRKLTLNIESFGSLPEPIFNENYRRFLFVDFSFVLSAKFFTALESIAEKESVELYYHVFDPEPEYYSNCYLPLLGHKKGGYRT